MEIVSKKISELIAAPYNPRMISEDALNGLTASVRRFGLVQPIVWNKRTGHVVGGHQRLKALQRLGASEALTVVVDLPEAEEKALNVTMNNPHIEGGFTADLEGVLDGLDVDLGIDFQDLKLDRLINVQLGEEEEGGGEDFDFNKDPNVLIRISFLPETWIGARPKMNDILEKIKARYGCTYRVEE